MVEISLKSPEGHSLAGFAVLDGHSGCLCVEHVVKNFPANLQKCIGAKPGLSDEHLAQAVHEACVRTDDEFLALARKDEDNDGSTMILALVYPQIGADGKVSLDACRLLTACIGDSRAVLCRAQAATGSPGAAQQMQLTAVPLSEDHKPNRPDEKRRIESKGGVVDFEGVWRVFIPGPANFGGQLLTRWGLAVSRSFGDLLLKEPEKYDCAGVTPGGLVTSAPEVRVTDLRPGADRFLVMASDGVWDVISNEEAVAICASQSAAERAAQSLLRRTYAASSDDNITALVLTWQRVE